VAIVELVRTREILCAVCWVWKKFAQNARLKRIRFCFRWEKGQKTDALLGVGFVLSRIGRRVITRNINTTYNSHNESRNKLRERNARKVFEYLTNHCCINCGESDPIVLEFDHRDRNDKIESVSQLIRNSSWKRIELEIQKCDVLCANCHRRKTAAEFNYKRHIFINL